MEHKIIKCKVQCKIKGGYLLTTDDLPAFLPDSETGRHGRILTQGGALPVNHPLDCVILSKKVDQYIVSRKKALELSADDFFKNIDGGQYVNGVVVTVQDYGYFVDLGPMDGFIHKTLSTCQLRKGDCIQAKVEMKDIGKKQLKLSYGVVRVSGNLD